MRHGTTAPLAEHAYNTGERCTANTHVGPGDGPIAMFTCNLYHYQCRDCGCDCTAGEPGGPAITDTQDVTRCRDCHEAWHVERACVVPATIEEMRALLVALSQIASDGDPLPVTDEHRKLATVILARHEAR